MYRVVIVKPNYIAARVIHVNHPLTLDQERSLLAPHPNCWLDVSKVDDVRSDDEACWEDSDYYDCFDPPPTQYGQLFHNGHFIPDYQKGRP